MLLIDKYAYTNKLSNINPQIKGSIGAIFLIASMLLKNKLLLLSIIILMSFIIVYVAKIDIKSYIKILKIPIYFLFIGISVNLINISFDSSGFII